MKPISWTTKTYQYNDRFYVDIVDDGVTYEAYLYTLDEGYKVLMFGVTVKDVTFEEFEKMVEQNTQMYVDAHIEGTPE